VEIYPVELSKHSRFPVPIFVQFASRIDSALPNVSQRLVRQIQVAIALAAI
jgi:hypothetical protein